MTLGCFLDLDGTTIFSGRFPRNKLRTTPVEWDSERNVTSWMTERAAEGLRELRENTEFTPTTTRVRRQLDRVHLPGGKARVAIYANGMRIRWDGAEDVGWSAALADDSWGCKPIDHVMRAVEADLAGSSWVRRAYNEDGIGVIITAAGVAPDDHVLSSLGQLSRDTGHALWRQGPKLFMIPAHGTKERAAEEIARRLGVDRTFAAGDTSLDRGLLTWADVGVQPAHAETGWNGTRTPERGIRAGEQILEFGAAVAQQESSGEPDFTPQGWWV